MSVAQLAGLDHIIRHAVVSTRKLAGSPALRIGRKVLIGLAFVALVGCAIASRPVAPEAQLAAERISSDIRSYQNGLDGTLAGATKTVKGASLFAMVYDQVRLNYVRDVPEDELIAAAARGIRERHPDPSKANDQELVEAAIHGMLTSLDAYSSYLDEPHLKALREQTRGQFGGLGIEVKQGDPYIDVVSPIDGTPAARAGLRPGDSLVRADDASLEGMLLRDAVLLLRGPPGSKITLTVKRGDQPPFDVTLERALINVASVRSRVEGDVGYIRISSFAENVGEEVASAVLSIKRDLGPRLRGYVLDLRNNPGGLLDQSIKVSDLFLHEGRIVSTRERTFENHYSARRGDLAEGRPIVVLINEGSASAAEIVAGALQDHHRATIIGTRSFGKGTVQTIIPLGRRDAVKLTTAVYLTPKGRSVDGGINPDVMVQAKQAEKDDPQLARALQLLSDPSTRLSKSAVSN